MISTDYGLYPSQNASWPADRPGMRPQDRSEEVQRALTAMMAPRSAPDGQAEAEGTAASADIAAAQAQLQKPRQAETAFHAQQIAQESSGEAAVEASAEDEEDSAAVKAFLDYMSKTPEERYFEAFLKSKGLTKEEFEALPPEEKQALLKELQEMVRDRTEAESAEKLARTAASQLL